VIDNQFMSAIEIILASASPRRLELMRQIGLEPKVRVAHIDETPFVHEDPRQYARRMAQAKAVTVKSHYPDEVLVIGADTVVVAEGQIFGKPASQEEAFAMLSSLSGKYHQVLSSISLCQVLSSISLCSEYSQLTRLVETKVRFRTLTAEEINTYWQTGEPKGKAGSYAIQGLAAVFIEEIQGSYSAVMGLPLFELAALLAETGLEVLDLEY
jgi:septum formation protein